MTDEDFTHLKYWADLAIKAVIGVVVSIVGMDYRSVKSTLAELQASKYAVSTELAVMNYEIKEIITRLERMEKKLDRTQ